MIKIDLEIGKPVDRPVYHNQYELIVKYMHGRRVTTTEQTHWYDVRQEKELKLDLLGLFVANNLIDSWDDLAEELAKIYDAQGLEDSYELAEKFENAFYEGDITKEDEGASSTGYFLFFHDADGVKRDVVVALNGKQVV